MPKQLAPTFRAYVRRDVASYQQPYVWQMRQPFYASTANGLSRTRRGALREILRDARHFQDCHGSPDFSKA